MKKVGIMTIHTTYNYGAVLQAYATQAFFSSRGYDAELINYTNPHVQEMLKLTYKQDGKLSGYFKTFVRNTIFGRLHYYKKGFSHIDDICKFSKKYKTSDDLKDVKYDVLVAGSDQLWNPLITGKLDSLFFLQFGEAKKRIAVASSLGSHLLTDSEKEAIKCYFEKFDYISVREQFAKKQLQSLTNKEIKILMDPTLLLTREFWINSIINRSQYKSKKEKYIVTYFAGGNKGSHRKIISEYAKYLNLPVWTIQYSNYTWKESSKKILGATIEDFVALIANADLVITDSFHGVAFSLNMGTNFIALTNATNPVRVQALLSRLGIAERIDMPTELYKPVNYAEITPILKDLQEDSAEWVIKAVEA